MCITHTVYYIVVYVFLALPSFRLDNKCWIFTTRLSHNRVQNVVFSFMFHRRKKGCVKAQSVFSFIMSFNYIQSNIYLILFIFKYLIYYILLRFQFSSYYTHTHIYVYYKILLVTVEKNSNENFIFFFFVKTNANT